MFKKTANKEPISTNPTQAFLKKCRGVIWLWISVLIFMAGFIIIEATTKSVWICIVFTLTCAVDIIATTKMIPISFQLSRNEIYKEKNTKKMLWKLRVLLIPSIIFSTGFVVWMWACNGNEASPIVKWLFAIILTMGLLFAKIFFTKIYINIRKVITTNIRELNNQSTLSDQETKQQEKTK